MGKFANIDSGLAEKHQFINVQEQSDLVFGK